MDRVAVFLDYENVHRTAHNLYSAYGTPTYSTVVDPIQIAERVVRKRNRESEISERTGAKPIWFPEGLRAVPKRLAPYCHFLKEHDLLDSRVA